MKARQRHEEDEEVTSKMTCHNNKKGALDGYRIASAVLLAASALLSLVIYLYDGFLQSLAPMTGMILLGSAVGDIVLIAVVARKPRLGFRLTTVWATLIFLGQLGNALNPGIGSAGFPQGFPAYLLGIAAVSPSSVCPYSCPPFRFSALALLLVQLPLILVASLGWRTSKMKSHAQEEENTQHDADHPIDAPIPVPLPARINEGSHESRNDSPSATRTDLTKLRQNRGTDRDTRPIDETSGDRRSDIRVRGRKRE